MLVRVRVLAVVVVAAAAAAAVLVAVPEVMGTALSRQKYESVSMSRKATGGDDSDEMDVSCGQRTILLVYDTFELSWDCCNIYRRCTDPDWHHHEIFLREKSALRQLGAELRRKLRDSFNFAEMTLEEDLRNCAPVPSHDVAVLLQHDWPTVNENPGWLLQFTNFVQMTPIVPNYTEVFLRTQILTHACTCLQLQTKIENPS